MSTEYENIAVEKRDQVAWMRMESTSRFNSLNLKMGEELFDVAVNLSEDDSVRCIVLVGSEGVFNSGADLSLLEGSGNDAPTLRKLASMLHDVIEQLNHAPKPVITGVNGVAAG
ncbi:MAG: enoyl-CoA hydratase/isomerase family protein, partial [Halobacteria archaeon]|nr:enoyl-CoA hydratase/isomerase family protein [Halobacteria archaeon]